MDFGNSDIALDPGRGASSRGGMATTKEPRSSAPGLLFRGIGLWAYIMPGMPPPGMPPGAPSFSSGLSATMASVVSSRLATLAAF